jgi:hypothetical protein
MELARDMCDAPKSSPEAARTFGIVLVEAWLSREVGGRFEAWLSREVGGRLGLQELMGLRLKEHYQATL